MFRWHTRSGVEVVSQNFISVSIRQGRTSDSSIYYVHILVSYTPTYTNNGVPLFLPNLTSPCFCSRAGFPLGDTFVGTRARENDGVAAWASSFQLNSCQDYVGSQEILSTLLRCQISGR